MMTLFFKKKSDHPAKHAHLVERIKLHRKKVAILTHTLGRPGRATCFWHKITLPDGNIIPMVVYRPNISIHEAPFPTVLHIPGSGFTTLNPVFAHITCSQLAEKSGCQIIVINHRLSPEYPGLMGVNDVETLFNMLIKKAGQFKIDTTRIALSGYSSGGTYAAVLMKRIQKIQPINYLILISPVMDLSGKLKQYQSFEHQDTAIPANFVEQMKRYHLCDGTSETHPDISPYWEPDIRGFAPTSIIVGEFDRFRSNAQAYAEKLQNASVPTHLKLIRGGNHGSFWYNIEVIESVAAQLQAVLGLFSIPRPLAEPDGVKSEHYSSYRLS